MISFLKIERCPYANGLHEAATQLFENFRETGARGPGAQHNVCYSSVPTKFSTNIR